MEEKEAPRFGPLLSRYRMAAGLSQEELAERAGLSSRGISDLERGARRRPHAATVHQLAEALNLSIDQRTLLEESARRARGSVDQALPTAPPVGEFLGALPAEPLVGREEELSRVQIVLDAVTEGTGQLFLLAGELGVGKTRLAQEVMARALERGFVVGTGRCYQRNQQTAYAPLFQALAQLPGAAPASAQPSIRRRWDSLRRGIDGLLSGSAGAAGRQHLFTLVTNFVADLAVEVPVALLVDDLQWADDGSITLFQHLAQATRGKRVLLLGTLRDARLVEEHPLLARTLQDLARERLAERMVVRRLSAEETSSLAASLISQETIADDIGAFLYRRTKGIPRFVQEMVRALGGRLELQGEIGAGAMGRVFAAYDTQTEQKVAAKIMLARGEVEIDALLRFQQEAAVLARLRHHNIVRIYDSFIDEHASCIIMELLEGESLGKILQNGRLPPARSRDLACQVADGLAYAHSQHIIHRDIKPDNVMVLEGDQVKVTDFGIARILQPDTSLETIATTGMRMGTPLYMAPEQIEGKLIDGRADIYALGAMLYHLVTGRPPFEGADALAVAIKHLQDDPPPPSQVEPTLPKEWDAVILKALAKAPKDRYQSAGEMRQAVEALPIEPVQPETRRAHRYRLPAVTAGAGAAFVTVIVILALLWPHFVAGQSQSPVQRHLEGYLTSLADQRQLSGTVLVAEKGKVLLAQGYGMANRQKKIPNSPMTEYAVAGQGSILVPAALRLEEESRLHDQDHVCSYLPACPRSWKPMTVHMVLAGIAGLPNSGWGTFGNTTNQSLTNCQDEPLVATPGSGPVNYQSCTGIVLGTIFQKVTGKPFAVAMQQLIFGPAGMRQSGRVFDQHVPPRMAREYSGGSPGQPHAFNDFFQIYSTAPDIYRYDNALFGGRLLSQSALHRLVAPRDVVALPDPTIGGARWGYHWKVGSLYGRQVAYSTGNSWDFTGVNMRFPAEGVTIVVMSNDAQNDVESVATHVAATLFGASVASSAEAIAPAVPLSRALVATINVPTGFNIAPSTDAVWVPGPPAPSTTGSVVRVDPRTNKVVATVRVNNPAALASGDPAVTFVAVGNGQVWVTDRVSNSVDRIDPATNRVVARIPVGIHPFGLAIAGQTLWTDNSYEDPGVVNNTIVKVDLRTKKVVATITNAQTNIGQPYLELHATPNALWFADWGSGTLKRLDTTTNKVVASIQTGPQPTSLAVTPGAIWVSNHTSTLVTRVDPSTNSMAATIPFEGYTSGQNTASDCCASATAAGAGAIWTIAGANTRTLVRIDPRTNEATAALTFPQSIDEIAVGDGSVWVAFDNEVDRLDPRAIP